MSILYIDDDQEDAEIFCEVLKEIDPAIKCTIATDGKTGLKGLDLPCPNFIFIDYRMPKLNGMEFLEHLSANRCFSVSRIVMYSTFMSDAQIEECKQLGVYECMRKTGDFSAMVSEIRKVLLRE